MSWHMIPAYMWNYSDWILESLTNSICADYNDTHISTCQWDWIDLMCSAKFLQENGWLYTYFNGGSAGSLQQSSFRQIFWPLLPIEYVTVFSRRTDAPNVRCDQTQRTTKYHNPHCTCVLRVNHIIETVTGTVSKVHVSTGIINPGSV